MNNWIPLPDLIEIEALELKRKKARDSLEFINEDQFVKCQGCQQIKPVMKAETHTVISRDYSTKILTLKALIRQIERYAPDRDRHLTAKKERQQLKDLEEEGQKHRTDIMRRLPLYSSKISDYRFLCSECYDKAEQAYRENMKEREDK